MKTSRILVAAAAALALAACSAPTVTADSPAYSASPAAAPTALADQSCDDATRSFAPSSTKLFPEGSLQQKIKARKRLIVGVSGDSLLLGSRDPESPNTFSGFDIDLARAVGKAIFPDGGGTVQFRVITAAQRIPLVNAGGDAGGVDLVARNMTMNCDRWQQVNFSAVYYVADQQVLVRSDSKATTLKQLVDAKARVCAPAGSTSIQRMVDSKYTGIVPVQVDQHTTCLALLQEGRVDAITGDSTVLAGLNAQDPKTTILKGASLGQEPYGLAVGKDQKVFAQFVNAVLKDYIDSGEWKTSADKWFPNRPPSATPPAQTTPFRP